MKNFVAILIILGIIIFVSFIIYIDITARSAVYTVHIVYQNGQEEELKYIDSEFDQDTYITDGCLLVPSYEVRCGVRMYKITNKKIIENE